MKKTLAATALSLTLLLGIASAAGAQQTQQGPYNQAPETTTNQNQGTGTTSTNDTNTLADWWWILPLLAIPLIYLLARRTKDEAQRDYTDQRYAGTKGGETRREREDDDF